MGSHDFIRNKDTCIGEKCNVPNPEYKRMSDTIMNKPVYCDGCGLNYGNYGQVVDIPDANCPNGCNDTVSFQPKEEGIFG